MAEAAFSLAVESLGNLLIQKADILLGVEGQVEELKDELERMQYFLRDAVERQAYDKTICIWTSQLREVAQDAEDVIEIFCSKVGITRRSRRLRLGRFANASSKIVYHPFRVAIGIKSIRTRLRDITRFGERYRRSEDVEWQCIAITNLQNDEDVFGLEQDVELLLDRGILKERIGLSVAIIVGLGGIGKSTLARLACNNLAAAHQFHCRAWIYLSSHLSLEEIIKKLAMQLLRRDEDEQQILETMERLQLQSLRLLIHRCLSGRRYLIVLDDVWEYAHLEALAGVFPDEGNGSRLLITSRNWDITKHAQYVHEMKILDPGKSWKLLLNTAFFRQVPSNCPEHLKHIAREILKKCHGLPLAIKEVGRLLAERQSWQDVLQTMDLSVLSDAFELSYHRLPPELKLCFLCLAFFKQGATIRAEKLVQVWIAGRMVPQEEQMEEIAASYLDNLIIRYMVRVEDKTKDDRVKNCRIYDIFHKPSMQKAEDEISLEILREEGTSRPLHKPRHRAIYCSRRSFINSVNQGNNYLRSLLFHGGGNFDFTPYYWKSFELLKVLDFEGFGLKEFPEAISALNGLRYLGLRNNYIKELPNSLGRLENLRVLDVSLNFAVVVPDVIWRMKSLRHLYMSEIICRTRLKIDTLKNLRTLTYIPVENWTCMRSSLQKMTSLRKLGIEEINQDSVVSNLLESLAHLRNLVCLNLRGSRFDRMPPSLYEVGYLNNLTQLKLDGLLTRLPGANDFPTNLCYLTLVNTSLDQDPMAVLEELPKLLYLRLRNAYTGDRMVISHQGFPKLQVLRVGELWRLRYVQVEGGAMAMLRRWEINSCPYLENLPRRATIID